MRAMAWEIAPNVVIPEALTESGPVLSSVHRAEDTKEAVEKALYAILGDGAFQRRIMACSLLSMVVLLCHSLAYRAIARPIDHWCARPAAHADMPVQLWMNVAIPVQPDGSFSRCTVYDPPLPGDHQVDYNRHPVDCDSWEYATEFRNSSIVSEWDLVCQRRRLVQLSSAAYMTGAMLCVPLVGLLSDRAGRKPVITGSVSILILAAIVCSATHSFVVFVLSRMVVSATSSAAQVLSFILLYEVTAPDRRAAYALLATATGIMLTPVVLELVAASQLSWQATELLLLMPTISLMYSHYLLEESPSWLLATWRLKRAEEALLVAARRNSLAVEKATRFFKKLKTEMRRHAITRQVTTTSEASPNAVKKTATSSVMVAEFLSNRRAMCVFLAWFTVMFCYYGIQLADQDIDGGADARLRWDDVAYVVTLAPLTTCTYAGMLRYGQRRTFIALLALVFEASALLVVVPATADHELLRHVLLKVFARAVTAAATSANYLYTAEVFPTAVRSTGLTVSYASGRVGAVFATALMSVQATHTTPLMNVAMMLLAFGATVAVQMVPESMAEAKESDAGVTGARAISSRASRGCEEIAAILKDPLTPWDAAHKSTAPLTRTRARVSTHLLRGSSKNESADSVSHGIPSCDEAIVKSHDEPKY